MTVIRQKRQTISVQRRRKDIFDPEDRKEFIGDFLDNFADKHELDPAIIAELKEEYPEAAKYIDEMIACKE